MSSRKRRKEIKELRKGGISGSELVRLGLLPQNFHLDDGDDGDVGSCSMVSHCFKEPFLIKPQRCTVCLVVFCDCFKEPFLIKPQPTKKKVIITRSNSY
jgi:hypothetical protein